MGLLDELGIKPPMPDAELEAVEAEDNKRAEYLDGQRNARELAMNLRLMGIAGLPDRINIDTIPQTILKELGNLLSQDSKSRACWLCGVAGCGKTTLISIAITEALEKGKRPAYINCRYLSRIFPSFDQPEDVKLTGRKIVSWAAGSDLLCIDDFGYEEISPKIVKDEFKRWMVEAIDRIERDESKTLVIGSEFTAQWFRDKQTYGLATESLMSRLRGLTANGKETLITGKDRRGK